MIWGTPVQSFVFLGLLVFELEPMYATSDRRTTDAHDRLMPPPPYGAGHNNHVTLKSRLRVTQGHWKWNNWTLNIIVTLKCGLEFTQEFTQDH